MKLRTRLVIVFLVASLAPHPISFREGGYLPLLSLVPAALEEPSVAGMVLLCLVAYCLPLLAISYLFLAKRRSTSGETRPSR